MTRPAIVSSLEELLNAEGFKVTTVSNGGAAPEQVAIAPIDLFSLT